MSRCIEDVPTGGWLSAKAIVLATASSARSMSSARATSKISRIPCCEHLSRLREVAQRPDRGARHRADPPERGYEHELLPQGDANILGDLRRYSRPNEDVAQSPGPFARAVVQLTELHGGRPAHVPDVAWLDDES